MILVNFSIRGKNKVCLNSKFPPTLHSTLQIQPATLFGEKCVRLYLLGYHSLCRFYNSKFYSKGKERCQRFYIFETFY
jgi:hypothetical protein